MENYSLNKVKYAFCLLFMGLFPQENEATALSWVGADYAQSPCTAPKSAPTGENGSQIDSTDLVAIVNNNAALQASEQYDINEKAVNAIYLSTIAIGNADFSEPQIQILIDIAYQCPITGGPAVFLARGLYDFVNAEAMYDDEDICAVQGQQWRQNQVKSKTEYIKIFPNPTDELVNIIVPISKQTYQISIFDALGNSIFTSTIAENTSEHTFSTASLANGVYYCVVKQSAEVIHAEKLIIIHH